MTALLLGALWGAVVLAGACRRRPAPARVRALVEPGGRRPRTSPVPAWSGPSCAGVPASPDATRPDLVAALGAAVLRRFPAAAALVPSATPKQARSVGAITVTAAMALVVTPALAPVVVLGGALLPRARARAAERRRLRSMEAALPDTVDLLMLAVGAGCNVPLAVAAAGRRGTGLLAAELRRVSAEVDRGRRLADALDELPARAGEPTRALAGVLAGCERYGTPVVPALHRLADEVRLQRQRRAEAAARRVPVTLLLPLVLCILPAFALLTVAPLVAGALRELRL